MKGLKITALFLLTLGTTACQKDCEEQTNRGGVCTADFTPVCGCNNKTYSNVCNAENVGITTYTQGTCK